MGPKGYLLVKLVNEALIAELLKANYGEFTPSKKTCKQQPDTEKHASKKAGPSIHLP